MSEQYLLKDRQEALALQVGERSDDGEDIPPLAEETLLAPGYRVVSHLHRTSLFDVYEAWSQERQCSCVTKVLRADYRDDPVEQRRLRREGRLLRRLAHPHIVRAYEMLEDPMPILILETLPGATLEALIEESRRRFDFADLVLLGLHISSAVYYLHRQGLLHLDLKPSNLISTYGFVRMLDLSLARPPGRYHRGIGTPLYMAPEQARGGLLTGAADVWGIGMVLFEAATGIQPFDEYGERMKYPQLEYRVPSIRAHRRVPLPFAHALDRCLDPDPAGRPAVMELVTLFRDLAR